MSIVMISSRDLLLMIIFLHSANCVMRMNHTRFVAREIEHDISCSDVLGVISL